MMNFPHGRPVPSASRGTARRHRIEGGRPCTVKVSFTHAEYDALTARAACSKVSVPRFLAECALIRRPQTITAPAALTAELAALRRLTANLANNINQIARKLNAGASPDGAIAPTLGAVRRTMNRLDTALAALHPAASGPSRITGPPPRPAPEHTGPEHTPPEARSP
jgi:Mobilization protein NikA